MAGRIESFSKEELSPFHPSASQKVAKSIREEYKKFFGTESKKVIRARKRKQSGLKDKLPRM